MKLGSLKEGGRDGTLIVVSRDLTHAARAAGIAPTLQAALDDWSNAAPRLNALYDEVNAGTAAGRFALDLNALAAPLPRAYEFVDGSAYLPHVERVRKARGAEVPESFYTDPLMYQATSAGFLGPRDPVAAQAANAACSGCSGGAGARGPRPSRPPCRRTRRRAPGRTAPAAPSTSTAQAPHSPSSQPCLVPVSARSSPAPPAASCTARTALPRPRRSRAVSCARCGVRAGIREPGVIHFRPPFRGCAADSSVVWSAGGKFVPVTRARL